MGVLEQERTIRQQKEQYSALARRIHTYPTRSETQSEIERLEAEIATLKGESDTVASALELRSKRFAGFMHALHDMQLLLESEQAAPMAL
jgi:THO complex subunit 7